MLKYEKLLFAFAIAAALLVCPARLDAAASGVPAFLSSYCVDCHDADLSKGGLNLADLPFNLTDPKSFGAWKRVYERVRDDEMPPKKSDRPQAGARQAFLGELKTALLEADRRDREARGRVHVRRLTRREYEHTLHDLLGVDLPLNELLPEDPDTRGFETVATGQPLSHHHLRMYLETADRVLTEAFDRATRGDRPYRLSLKPAQLARRTGGNYRGPQLLDGVCHFWPMTLQFYGRMPMTEVRRSGWYRVTLRDVRAVNPRNRVVWGTLRSGACNSSSPLLYPVGLVEATEQKRDLTFEAWIRAGHMLELKPNDATQRRARTGARGGNVAYPKGRSLFKEGCEGIEISGIEIERIYPNSTPEQIRRRLFGGLNASDVARLKTDPGDRSIYEKAIAHFANRAFRRPVTPEQIRPYVELALEALKEPDQRPKDALRAAYRGILCSPRFLTFVEAPGQLDDHALATRLSYALWCSMPDDELRRLADQGRLSQPEVFDRQVRRLIADSKFDRFIASFADQWLKLKEIDFTQPDRRLYRTFDEVVKQSMLAETRAFLKVLIRENLPAAHLVQSDFAMLNERLARFYGLPTDGLRPGAGLQRVALPGNPRAGLITQGAVLKVTANGTTTSPVVRGAWVSERILGMEVPPPPADVPAVEPDIRGAISIRDQLEKHRNNESCNSCHRKIDPPGFALENFDPVGLFRSRYGARSKSARIDPSGVTPDGQPFADLRQWKAIYAARPEMLARAFARHLLTYATGAPPRFSDEAELDRIVARARSDRFGLQSVLRAALDSPVFKTK